MVQKSQTHGSGHTSAIALSDQFVAPHHLIEEISALFVLCPIVGFDQHRPQQRAEHLRIRHQLVADGHELRRSHNHRELLFAPLLVDSGKPASGLDHTVEQPTPQLDPDGPAPCVPVVVSTIHHRPGHRDLLLGSASRMPVLALDPFQ